MRVAIVGGGFSGLALAWNLLNFQHQVVVFDPLLLGSASAIAAGLLHPYIGQEGRRSLFATEALKKTENLLQIAEKSLGKAVYTEGVIRFAQNEVQKNALKKHSEVFKDVCPLENNSFLIKSGRTVFCKNYLHGLQLAILKRGGQFVAEKITDLGHLQLFDKVIVAAGSSIRDFPELQQLKVSFVKGQVLTCRVLNHMQIERSLIGKGYIAVSNEPRLCYVGATYERGKVIESPNLLQSQKLLFGKVSKFYPDVEHLEAVDCSSAVRVMRRGHYLPIAEQISSRLWTLTAMGSRGLLYHAYFGEKLAQTIEGISTLSFQ